MYNALSTCCTNTFEKRALIDIHRRLNEFFGHETFDVSTVRHDQEEVGEIIRFTSFKAPQNGANRRIEDENQQSNLGKSPNNATTVSGKTENQSGYCSQANWRTRLQKHMCQVGAKIADCENEEKQKGISQQLLDQYCNEGEDLLKNLVTSDESWVIHYDPEFKEMSKEYRHRSFPRHKKIKVKERLVNTCYRMLSTLWYMKGAIC